jgi:hypothetical protein
LSGKKAVNILKGAIIANLIIERSMVLRNNVVANGKETLYKNVTAEDLIEYGSVDMEKLHFNEKSNRQGVALMVAMQIMLDGIGLAGIGEKLNPGFALLVAGFRAPKTKLLLVPEEGFRSPVTDPVPNIEVIGTRLLESVEEIKSSLPGSLSTSAIKREYGMAWIRNQQKKKGGNDNVDSSIKEKEGSSKGDVKGNQRKLVGREKKYYPLYGISHEEAASICEEDFILPEELVTMETVTEAKEVMEEMFCCGEIDSLEERERNMSDASIEQYLYRVNNVNGQKYAGSGRDEERKCMEKEKDDRIIGHVLAVHNFGSEEFRDEVIAAVNESPFLESSEQIGQGNKRYYRYSSISKGAFFIFGNEGRVIVSDAMTEVERKLHKVGCEIIRRLDERNTKVVNKSTEGRRQLMSHWDADHVMILVTVTGKSGSNYGSHQDAGPNHCHTYGNDYSDIVDEEKREVMLSLPGQSDMRVLTFVFSTGSYNTVNLVIQNEKKKRSIGLQPVIVIFIFKIG